LAIHQHVHNSAFDAETVRIMIDAYECARRELNQPTGHNTITHRIADLVLAMAENGEKDPKTICQRVVLALQTN
jgi:hypothetical protein